MSRITVLLVLFALIGLALVAPAGLAQPLPCPATYTVQPGDWLSSIARRHNITLVELLDLNVGRIENVNLIYPGQQLCVPRSTPPAAVALQSQFRYEAVEDEQGWSTVDEDGTLTIGRRVELPLAADLPVTAVGDGMTLKEEIQDGADPALVGLEVSSLPVLVAVGDPELFSTLHLSGTVTLNDYAEGCTLPPEVAGLLGDERVQESSLSLWLEIDTVGYPFEAMAADAVTDRETFLECYGESALQVVIYPADGDQFRAEMVLNEAGHGPPGRPDPERCDRWRYGGTWFAWLRRAFGCP